MSGCAGVQVCRCAGVKVCAGVRFQCGRGQDRVAFQCEMFHVSVWYVEAQCANSAMRYVECEGIIFHISNYEYQIGISCLSQSHRTLSQVSHLSKAVNAYLIVQLSSI